MRNIVDASKLDLKSTIVSIRRVAKTVKGGRNMRFSVTVVVGDGNGYVGVGLGKSQEIPEAVRKATEDAKKNLKYWKYFDACLHYTALALFFRCETKIFLVLQLIMERATTMRR